MGRRVDFVRALGVVTCAILGVSCASSDAGMPDAGSGGGDGGGGGSQEDATGAGSTGGGGSGSGGESGGGGLSSDGGAASAESSAAAAGSGSSSGESGASSDSGGSSSSGGSSPLSGGAGTYGGSPVTHTMADCDTLAAADTELVLPLTKTKATKPTLPAAPTASACVLAGAVSTPDESQTAADTARITTALASAACPVVQLVSSGANAAFISGPLDIVGPKVLWIDTGVTLYASVNADLFAYSGRTSCGAQSYDEDCDATGGTQCTALINMSGAGPQLVGGGTIDGQGGKPIIVGGAQQTYSWWDLSVALRDDDDPDGGVNPGNCASTPASQRGGSAPNPQLIIGGATSQGKTDKKTSGLVVAGLTLHNSPKFHIKFASEGFTIWGNTILTPSDKSVPPINARNTDGIDPGEGYLATGGAIVCNMISTGDDDIVLKGHYGVGNVVVAHNHFGTGHGMSIGSETQGIPGLTAADSASSTTTGVGVQDVDIYDITIDGDTRSTGGAPGSDINGVRVKSDTYRGGIVQTTTFHDICTRDVVNPLIVNPHYSAKTTTPPLIPYFKDITVRNLNAVLGTAPVTPIVTLEGYDMTHPTGITLDDVVVQGITAANILSDMNTTVTIPAGSAGVSFAIPAAQPVAAGDPVGIACDWGWPVPRPQ